MAWVVCADARAAGCGHAGGKHREAGAARDRRYELELVNRFEIEEQTLVPMREPGSPAAK
jgi:hypothetical protein